jgi:ribosomal protein L25 (general stress protein Ctc)
MKIHTVGAELFHADRQTETERVDKATSHRHVSKNSRNTKYMHKNYGIYKNSDFNRTSQNEGVYTVIILDVKHPLQCPLLKDTILIHTIKLQFSLKKNIRKINHLTVFRLDLPKRRKSVCLNSEIQHADNRTHITFQLCVFFNEVHVICKSVQVHPCTRWFKYDRDKL